MSLRRFAELMLSCRKRTPLRILSCVGRLIDLSVALSLLPFACRSSEVFIEPTSVRPPMPPTVSVVRPTPGSTV